MLSYVPSTPTFWRVLIINGCWILSEAFSACIEMIVWFLFFSLLMWCTTLWMMKNPCIPGVNCTWSWCMIFLLYCWIRIANILLSIFASMKLSEFINEFGKVAGYKINTQKSVAFLYTNHKRSEKEIQEAIPFTITSKNKIKYLGINLPKETKDLYSKNYKMLMKEIKEDINRSKDTNSLSVLWISFPNMYTFQMLARLCSKSFKVGFNSIWTENFHMYKVDLERAEEPEIKLPTSVES